MNIKKSLIGLISAGTLILSGCGNEDGGTGGSGGTTGGTSSDKTHCYEMNLEEDSGLIYGWHAENSYGSNNIFVHELTENCKDTYWCFLNGTPLNNNVLKKDETIPASKWRAWRPFAGDGNNPRKFTEEDPFIIGYLPHLPKSHFGWKSKDTTYDWSCEEGDDKETNGLENCIGLNQLDKSFTLNTLTPGKTYLARLLFGANPNNTGNRILFCKQAIFEYKGKNKI